MKSRFDLEQEILSCWRVTEDLQVVYEMIEDGCSQEDLLKTLFGMKTLYDKKFEIAFDTFEQCVRKREFNDREWKEKTEY